MTFDVSTNEVTAEVKTEIEDLVADADIDGVALYPSQDIAQTGPVDPRPGRDRRRRHRRDRPVRHARDRDRRRPAARHRPARGRGRIAGVAVVLGDGRVRVRHAGARRDAGPRGRHRLLALHHQPAPSPADAGRRRSTSPSASPTAPRATRSSSPASPSSSRCSRLNVTGRRLPRPDGHRRCRRRPRRHPDGRHPHPGDPLAGRACASCVAASASGWPRASGRTTRRSPTATGR